MFYSQFILAKKGPLGTIWIAAHLERKLKKNQVADTDIGDSVDSILFPDVPIALRLSSHLLLGVVRIYSRKVNYLFHDCSEALLKVKQAFRSTAVDLPPEESTAPYHSITLPETFDLDDFELPDSALNGNFDDRHVSSREQITLQDTLDGTGYSTLQFGLDERFGDGDASQIGLDLDEELLLDNNLKLQHDSVSYGDAHKGEGASDLTKMDMDETQLGCDEDRNNEASKELSELLCNDRGKHVISDVQNVNRIDDSSHRLVFNIRTPDLNEVFLPDDHIGGPSGAHNIDMDVAAADPPSPEFNEFANFPSMPIPANCQEPPVSNPQEILSYNDIANGKLDKPITQEVECPDATNENLVNATSTDPELDSVAQTVSPSTSILDEPKSDFVASQCLGGILASSNPVNDVCHIHNDSKAAANNGNLVSIELTYPKLSEVSRVLPSSTLVLTEAVPDSVVPPCSDGTVGTPGLVGLESIMRTTETSHAVIVGNEANDPPVSMGSGIPYEDTARLSNLDQRRVEEAHSYQTNNFFALSSDFQMRSCTSVTNQANLISPSDMLLEKTPGFLSRDQPCNLETAMVDQELHFSGFSLGLQGFPSSAIDTNLGSHQKSNDIQLGHPNCFSSSEFSEPERMLISPSGNVNLSSDFGQQTIGKGVTNLGLPQKSNDIQLGHPNCFSSSEFSEPERMLFAPSGNVNLSSDFGQQTIGKGVTNFGSHQKSNDIQLGHPNCFSSSEFSAPERMLFAPSGNVNLSSDFGQQTIEKGVTNLGSERMLFSPSGNVNLSSDFGQQTIEKGVTNLGSHQKSNDIQLGHHPNCFSSSEFSVPERMLFAPPGNVNLSSDFGQQTIEKGVTNLGSHQKSNDIQLGHANCFSSSEFSAPERMLFAPSGNVNLLSDFGQQTIEKGVIESDGSVDRISNRRGQKRHLVDNTPESQNGISPNMFGIPQKKQNNDYIIPKDDDLLASILVGRRAPVLKIGPTPPLPKPPSSKRPRLTQKVGLPKRRKVLLDDTIVLHADAIRQQLMNTEDIRRMRRKAPCTRPEIWRIQKSFIEEDNIFCESIFIGISDELNRLLTRRYDPVQNMHAQANGHHSMGNAIKEFEVSKSSPLARDNDGREIAVQSALVTERVDGNAIKEFEVSKSSPLVTHLYHSMGNTIKEFEVSKSSPLARDNDGREIAVQSALVTERVDGEIQGASAGELIDAESCQKAVSIDAQEHLDSPFDSKIEENHNNGLADAENNLLNKELQTSHQITEVNDNALHAANLVSFEEFTSADCVTVNDDTSVQEEDLSNARASSITVEDMGVDIVNANNLDRPQNEQAGVTKDHSGGASASMLDRFIVEVGADFPEDSSTVIEHANSSVPDLGMVCGDVVVDGEKAAMGMVCGDVVVDGEKAASEVSCGERPNMASFPIPPGTEGEHVPSAVVEDMGVDIVNVTNLDRPQDEHASITKDHSDGASASMPDRLIVEVGADFPEDSSTVIEHANSSIPDMGMACGDVVVNGEKASCGERPNMASFPVPLSTEGERVPSAVGENSGMNAEGGLDVESTHMELAATRESSDFCSAIDDVDTDFLNVDDDAEYDEETFNDAPNTEEAQSLENCGWSSRTRGVARYLKTMFDQESGRGRKLVAVDHLLGGKTRKEASRMFFETLVLKTRDYIHVEQDNPFSCINIKPRIKLLKTEF